MPQRKTPQLNPQVSDDSQTSCTRSHMAQLVRGSHWCSSMPFPLLSHVLCQLASRAASPLKRRPNTRHLPLICTTLIGFRSLWNIFVVLLAKPTWAKEQQYFRHKQVMEQLDDAPYLLKEHQMLKTNQKHMSTVRPKSLPGQNMTETDLDRFDVCLWFVWWVGGVAEH